jgi:Fe2+ transport system protein B
LTALFLKVPLTSFLVRLFPKKPFFSKKLKIIKYAFPHFLNFFHKLFYMTKNNIYKIIFYTFLFSLILWLISKFIFIEKFNDIEIKTNHQASPVINDIMKNINSIGNQMVADSEFDKVDQNILNSRKL